MIIKSKQRKFVRFVINICLITPFKNVNIKGETWKFTVTFREYKLYIRQSQNKKFRHSVTHIYNYHASEVKDCK